MKLGKEDLYNAITDIDDRFIEEADSFTFKKKFNWVRFSSSLGAVAAVLLVGFVGYFTFFNTAKSSNDLGFSNMTMMASEESGRQNTSVEESMAVDFANGKDSDIISIETAEAVNGAYEYKSTLSSEADSFSGNLLTAAFTKESNTVVSPVNVYLAMGMLAEITDNNSRQQVLQALDESSIEGLRYTAESIYCANSISNDFVTSNLAAAIWLSDRHTYKSDTLSNLSSHYFADSFTGEMGSVAYNGELHDWLNKNTGNLLKDQVGGINFKKDTNTALTTTLYFKSSWANEFSKYATSKDTFKALGKDEEADFMKKTEKGRYCVATNYTAATMGMQQGYSMTFILPKKGLTPNELIKDKETLEFILSGDNGQTALTCQIRYCIPKFDVDSQLELTDIIAAMGASDVMNPNISDFTALTSDDAEIYVSEIIHGARVKIDEEGCEAAAYTVIIANDATAIMDEKFVDFIVDRPFIFVIRNSEGMPLFVGTVYTVQR